jgi:uracil-DNA glycosylase
MTSTLNLEALAEAGLIHPSWVGPLRPVQAQLDALAVHLGEEKKLGIRILPAPDHIMRAFTIPFNEVSVVIVGQDPYPTPGDAVGLAFSVAPGQAIPRSLANIFTELHSDVGMEKPVSGDLSPWCDQGVMLLNRVLTVRAANAGSHRGMGWESVTEQALTMLDRRPGDQLVAVLWGNDAQSAQEYLPNSLVISSVHPSPLSASRGFFGSRPFSKVNAALVEYGKTPINWALPHQTALF